jgi:hypothetical protein
LIAARAAGLKLGPWADVSELELPEAGDSVDLYDTFITRWAAGMSQTCSIIEVIAGATHDRRRRAADLGAVPARPEESGAQYLSAIQQHQLLARMIARYTGTTSTPTVTTCSPPTLGAVPPARPLRPVRPDRWTRWQARSACDLHRCLQRHWPAGDLAALEVRRRRAADRDPAGRADGERTG